VLIRNRRIIRKVLLAQYSCTFEILSSKIPFQKHEVLRVEGLMLSRRHVSASREPLALPAYVILITTVK
jgi:hypothetical protein